MKRIEHRVLGAALMAMALGACTMAGTRDDVARSSATGSTSNVSDAQYGSAESAGARSDATAATGDRAGTAGGTSTGNAAAGSAMASTPNSTVTSIDVIPRQGGTGATGAGTVAGAAVGGVSGATGTSDRVYRITLRMDNGTVQTITQERPPAFTTGDRVVWANGAIMR